MTLAAEASERIATECVAGIEAALTTIREFPLSGPAREALAPGLRVVFHASYAIYYRTFPDAIVIVRVIHGARDIAALAERGGLA